MRTNNSFFRALRSLPLLPAIFGIAAVAASTGCVVEETVGDSSSTTSTFPNGGGNAVTVNIDLDQPLTSKPGQGVGVLVDVDDSNVWHVTTYCDTEISGRACDFDIFLSSAGGTSAPSNVSGINLDDRALISEGVDSSVKLSTVTDFGAEGIQFTLEGQLELEVYLDGGTAPNYIYWVGDNLSHKGAPSDPVIFNPVSETSGAGGAGGGGTGGAAGAGGAGGGTGGAASTTGATGGGGAGGGGGGGGKKSG